MKLSDFDYQLPSSAIAQHPLKQRDRSKLMVLNRQTGETVHHQFFELPILLDQNTVLVFNQSRVLPARLTFKEGKGEAEILLVKATADPKTWQCMVKPGKKFPEGRHLRIDEVLSVHIKKITSDGLRLIEFEGDDLNTWLKEKGQAPTPPYIKETLKDPERYQTVYSKTEGSVAAPTAGLHFTPAVFEALKKKGIQTEFITLHVGLGTFQGVKAEEIKDHKMHSEWFSLSEESAGRINQAKKEGRPVIAVGTTSVRVLEHCAEEGKLRAQSGETDIFIHPGYRWQMIDGMITNFHVPKSTLLMLVSAFAGREVILSAYQEALEKNYRFFSFGDCLLLT